MDDDMRGGSLPWIEDDERVIAERAKLLWRDPEDAYCPTWASHADDYDEYTTDEEDSTGPSWGQERAAAPSLVAWATFARGISSPSSAETGFPPALTKLRGLDGVVRCIRDRVVELARAELLEKDGVFACLCARDLPFPAPSGIDVNMMPVVLGDLDTVPEELRGYAAILRLVPLNRSDWGKVGYLTIDERPTKPGAAQRRPGLHCEAPPGRNYVRPQKFEEIPGWNCLTLAWGRGYFVQGGPPPKPAEKKRKTRDDDDDDDDDDDASESDDDASSRIHNIGHFVGGVYFASTRSRSTRLWNAKLRQAAPRHVHGDVEYLRGALGPGNDLDAGDLCWATDATPHESLPLDEDHRPRQFFRLVVSNVDVWYSAHSTPNPLGTKPPPHVRIVHADKFAT